MKYLNYFSFMAVCFLAVWEVTSYFSNEHAETAHLYSQNNQGRYQELEKEVSVLKNRLDQVISRQDRLGGDREPAKIQRNDVLQVAPTVSGGENLDDRINEIVERKIKEREERNDLMKMDFSQLLSQRLSDPMGLGADKNEQVRHVIQETQKKITEIFDRNGPYKHLTHREKQELHLEALEERDREAENVLTQEQLKIYKRIYGKQTEVVRKSIEVGSR